MRSRITARIDVGNIVEGQRGGLAMFRVRPGWIGLVRAGGQTRVTLASAGTETAGPPVARRIVLLRLRVERRDD